MKSELRRILEGKQIKRRKLASLPIAEKLAMLDMLRDRARAIRDASVLHATAGGRESQAKYASDSKDGEQNQS